MPSPPSFGGQNLAVVEGASKTAAPFQDGIERLTAG